MAYEIQIFSKTWGTDTGDGTLDATLSHATNISIQKEINQPERITFQVPRGSSDADELAIGKIVKVLDGTDIVASGVLVGPLDKTQVMIPVQALGKSEILNWQITPWDFALEGTTAQEQVEELLKNYRVVRQNRPAEFNSGTHSDTEAITVAGDPDTYFITLDQNADETYPESGTYTSQPLLCTDDVLGSPDDITRLRYKAELGNATEITVEVRYSNNAANDEPDADADWTAWSSAVDLTLDNPEKLGITSFTSSADFRWVQVRFSFSTTDTSITPALEAFEIVCEFPSEITAGSISLSGAKVNKTFSFTSHLDAIRQIVSARNAELRVNDDYTLDVSERFGVTTPAVTFYVGGANANCNVVQYRQEDRRLSTQIWALSRDGDGLTQTLSQSVDDTAVETYGDRPWIFAPIATDSAERTTEISDELDLRKTPALSVIVDELATTRLDISLGDLVNFEYSHRSIDTQLRVIGIRDGDPRNGIPRQFTLLSDEGFFAAEPSDPDEPTVSGTVSGLEELEEEIDRLLEEYPIDTLEWRGIDVATVNTDNTGAYSGVLVANISDKLLNTTEGDATITVVSTSSNIASASYDSANDEIDANITNLQQTANGTVTIRASVTIDGNTTTTDDVIKVRLVYPPSANLSGISDTISGLATSVSGLSGTVASNTTKINNVSGRLSSVSGAVPSTTTFATQSQVSGLSGRIDTLSGRLASVSGGVPDSDDYATPSQISGLSGRIDTANTAISGLSGRIDTLSGRVASVSGGVPSITNLATLTQISGLSGRIDSLSGRVASVSGNLDAVSGKVNNVSGRVSSVSGTLSTYATQTQISGLSGRIDGVITSISGVSDAVSGVRDKVGNVSGKLNNVSGNLDSVSGKLDNVSGRLASVSGGVPDISNLATQTQISGLSGRIDGVITSISGVSDAVSGVRDKVGNVSGKLNNVSGNLDSVSGKLDNVSGQLSSVSGAIPDDVSGRLASVSGNLDAVSGKLDSVSGQLSSVSGAIPDDVSGRLASVSGNLDAVSGKLDSVSGQLSSVSGAIPDDVSGRLASVSGNLDSVSGKLDNVSGQLASVSGGVPGSDDYATPSQISGLSGRIDDVVTSISGVSDAVSGVKDKVDNVSGNLSGVSDKVDDVSGKLNGVSGRVSGLSGEIETHVNTLSGLISGLSDEIQNVSGDVNTLSGLVSGLSGGVNTLSGLISGLDTTVSGLDTTVSGLDTTVSGFDTRISGIETSTSAEGLFNTVRNFITGIDDSYIELEFDEDNQKITISHTSGLSGILSQIQSDISGLSGLIDT